MALSQSIWSARRCIRRSMEWNGHCLHPEHIIRGTLEQIGLSVKCFCLADRGSGVRHKRPAVWKLPGVLARSGQRCHGVLLSTEIFISVYSIIPRSLEKSSWMLGLQV
jgi:hypothetical protein